MTDEILEHNWDHHKNKSGYLALDKDFNCNNADYEEKIYIEKFYKDDFCGTVDLITNFPLLDKDGFLFRFAKISINTTYFVSDKYNSTDIAVYNKKIKVKVNKEVSFNECIINAIKDVKNIQNYKNKIKVFFGKKIASIDDYSHLVSDYNYSRISSSGVFSTLISSGDNGQLASTGFKSRLINSGKMAQIASSGDDATLISSGDNATLASSGNNTKIISHECCSFLAACGDYSDLISSGNYSRLTACGDNSTCISTGKNSIISIMCKDGKFKGVKGTYVVSAIFNKSDYCIGFITGCIGEDGLEENTWYEVKDGKFVKYKKQRESA